MTAKVVPIAGPPMVTFEAFFAGQRGTDATLAWRRKAPYAFDILDISAGARASGGTTPTLAADVLVNGVSVLSTPLGVSTGTSIAFAGTTLSTARVQADDLISITLDFGGTTPTFDDILITIDGVRL